MTDIKSETVYRWVSDHSFQVTKEVNVDGIMLTCVAGSDAEMGYREGSTWVWQSDEEAFNHNWEVYAQRQFVSVWLNVTRWHDGSTGFDYDGPYETWASAFDSYTEHPFDEDGNPCILLETVEVRHYL